MLGVPPPSHCVTCVPTYIVYSVVELGGVCEVREEMGQQREELLREMELLKTELTGKCGMSRYGCANIWGCVYMYTHTYMSSMCMCVCVC